MIHVNVYKARRRTHHIQRHLPKRQRWRILHEALRRHRHDSRQGYQLTNNLLPGSRITWLTSNPNGEAEVVKVTLKPKLRLKNLSLDVDFSKQAIKGRSAQGNLVTKNDVARFSLKERGQSTLGGRNVWFDFDVMRINYDGRGTFLGEFGGNDRSACHTRIGRILHHRLRGHKPLRRQGATHRSSTTRRYGPPYSTMPTKAIPT